MLTPCLFVIDQYQRPAVTIAATAAMCPSPFPPLSGRVNSRCPLARYVGWSNIPDRPLGLQGCLLGSRLPAPMKARTRSPCASSKALIRMSQELLKCFCLAANWFWGSQAAVFLLKKWSRSSTCVSICHAKSWQRWIVNNMWFFSHTLSTMCDFFQTLPTINRLSLQSSWCTHKFNKNLINFASRILDKTWQHTSVSQI